MLSVRHETQHELAEAIDLLAASTYGSSDIFVPLAEI